MNRHNWTYQENEICCRHYIEHYVLQHSGVSTSALVRLLKEELPQLKETSIKRKISNIKYLSVMAGLVDSSTIAPSANCSTDNKHAFSKLLKEYNLSNP